MTVKTSQDIFGCIIRPWRRFQGGGRSDWVIPKVRHAKDCPVIRCYPWEWGIRVADELTPIDDPCWWRLPVCGHCARLHRETVGDTCPVHFVTMSLTGVCDLC